MRTAPLVLVAAFSLGAPASLPGQPPSFVMAACGGEATRVADVTLPHTVLANGQPLAAGPYEIRITTQRPAPAPGASPGSSCWVQFVREGVLAGRELASVVAQADIGAVAKGPAPLPGAARVDLLNGGEYYRVWVNHAGTHYIINLPPGP